MLKSFLDVWNDIRSLLLQIAAIRSEVTDDATTIKNALAMYKVLSAHTLEMQHFAGTDERSTKFVYCPIGNIVSWSAGDYDHKWCHYCKKYFEELK